MGDRLTLALPRLGFGALVAAAFVVPIAYVGWLADPFSLPKATVSWLAAAVAVGGVVVGSASQRSRPFGRLAILAPLAVLVGWTVLATALSPVPWLSLMGQYGRYDGLLALLAGATAALSLVAYTWRDPDRLRWVAWAMVAAGAVGLVVVVAQGLGWGWVGRSVPGLESASVVGLGGNPNFSGASLALVVPFLLGVRTTMERPALRAGLAVAVVAVAGGVVWTGTRGGLIGLLGAVAGFGLLAPALLPKVLRWGAAAALVVAVGVVLVSSASDDLPERPQPGVPSLLEASSLGERQNIWAGAVAMVESSPLVGVGPDAFGLRFPYERTARPLGRALISADEAHNIYLDRAATAGLPALIAYLWMLGTVGVTAWRARGRIADPQRWLLGAFGGALAGYLAQGAFSIDMVPLAFTAWLCIGAVVALGDPSAIEGRAAREPSPGVWSVPVPVLAGVLVGLVVAFALALRPMAADRHAREGAVTSDRPLDAYGAFASASGWLDHEPGYRQRQGALLAEAAGADDVGADLRRSLLGESLIAYRQALERAPGDVATKRAIAEVHLLAAEAASSEDAAGEHLDAAAVIYRDLLGSVRAADDLHLGYGRVLEVRARLGPDATAGRDRSKAAEQYRLAAGYPAHRAAALEGQARIAIAEGRLASARRMLVEAQQLTPGDPDLGRAIDELDRQMASGS